MIYSQSVFEPWPIENESIQAVITSPPYFALRKYSIPDVIIGGDKDCKHEFNLKQTYNKNHIQGGDCQRPHNFEMQKYSKHNTGFCIYCGAWQGQYGLEPSLKLYIEHCKFWMQEAIRVLKGDGVIFVNLGDSYSGKCQLLIPERFVIMCVDELNLISRNAIIWYKTNGMPESVTDRFSKKYEFIFFFTKQPDYYFNLDSILEPYAKSSLKRYSLARGRNLESVSITEKGFDSGCSDINENYPQIYKTGQGSVKARGNNKDSLVVGGNNSGKNPGDVWQIPTQPSSEKHFAMWPERLVERMIKCSTKAGDTVLDPFAGSGATLKVAEELQRKAIGIDLGYHEISKKRTGKIQKRLFV